MIRFTKIKHDPKKLLVELHTSESKGATSTERIVRSYERPHPDFEIALQRCLGPALDVCELSGLFEDDTRDTRVSSVSMNEDKDGNRGATVTMLRSLVDRPVPLVLNTPYLKSSEMPGELSAALEDVEAEARAFLIDGKRAQADLFATGTVTSEPATAGV